MKPRSKDLGYFFKSSKYSESSLILKAFTRQHGLISILAKGIRKKQEVNLLQPLCEYEFSFYEPLEGGLFLLAEFALITDYDYTANVERWAAAECALELYSTLIIAMEENPAYYHLLQVWLEYLRKLDTNTILVWWRFLLRVFQMLGVPFQPNWCHLCQHTDVTGIAYDKQTIGLLCKDCLSEISANERIELLSSQSSMILHLLPNIGNHMEAIKPHINTVKQLNELFAEYYGYHFNNALKLRSLSVLEQFYG